MKKKSTDKDSRRKSDLLTEAMRKVFAEHIEESTDDLRDEKNDSEKQPEP